MKTLFLSTWLGWLTGLLLIKTPWGPPTFTSWKSATTAWSAIVLIVQHLILLDFVGQTKLLNSLAVNELARKLHYIMLGVTYWSFLTVRVVFTFHAKTLCMLLGTFYNYQFRRNDANWKQAWRVVNIFIFLSGALVISSAGVFIRAVLSKQKADFHFISIFGTQFSSLLGTFFGHLATNCATNVAFAITVYMCFYLGSIFCDFCYEVESILEMQIKPIRIYTKEFVAVRKESKVDISLQSSASRNLLLNKFDAISKLFQVGSKVLEPLALVVIVSETFRSVSGAHEILINKLGGLFIFDSYLTVTQQLIHAGLVFIGQYVKDKMNERKRRLKNLVTLVIQDADVDKCNAILTAKCIIDFDWKLSACGFFNVDKKLLSGIVATAMTYIVILVQLQLSLHSTGCFSNVVLTTNSSQTPLG